MILLIDIFAAIFAIFAAIISPLLILIRHYAADAITLTLMILLIRHYLLMMLYAFAIFSLMPCIISLIH
jgi:hypothetical protein